MSYKKRFLKQLFLLPLFVSIVLTAPVVDCLADQVVATLQQQDQNLRLDISVAAPAPTSLIAVIQLPPNTKIAAISPKTAKREPKKSRIKWLVKNPAPGTLRFSATTMMPIDFSKVTAEILYRKPGGDKLIKIAARKR